MMEAGFLFVMKLKVGIFRQFFFLGADPSLLGGWEAV
jgi:hypothetical protein